MAPHTQNIIFSTMKNIHLYNDMKDLGYRGRPHQIFKIRPENNKACIQLF